MKLKDININAEDLLNFLNEHLVFEQIQPSEEGIVSEWRFFHKIEFREVAEFISNKCNEKDKQTENNVDTTKQPHECFLNARCQSIDSMLIKKNIVDKH